MKTREAIEMRVIAVMFFILAAACLGPRDENIQIHPHVTYQGDVLTIDNLDDFAYYNVGMRLNGGTFRMDMKMPILAGQSAKCNLSDFTKSDGERFNLYKYKPTDISISCRVVQADRKDGSLGEAFYHGRF